MSRRIWRSLFGTKEDFCNSEFAQMMTKVDGAELYWADGALAVVASKEWCDYMHERTDTIPQEQCDEDNAQFDFDDQSFRNILGIKNL